MSKNIEFASVGGTDKGQSVANIQSISLGTAVPHCSVSDMDESFLDKLLLAQKCAGVKFRINSAYRSVQYEKSKDVPADLRIVSVRPLIYPLLIQSADTLLLRPSFSLDSIVLVLEKLSSM